MGGWKDRLDTAGTDVGATLVSIYLHISELNAPPLSDGEIRRELRTASTRNANLNAVHLSVRSPRWVDAVRPQNGCAELSPGEATPPGSAP